MTSGAKSDGRFGKQDFVYLPPEDVYLCPAGKKLAYSYTNEEDGKTLRRSCEHSPVLCGATARPSPGHTQGDPSLGTRDAPHSSATSSGVDDRG